MQEVLYSYEVVTVSYDLVPVKSLTAEEYFRARDLDFGGFCFYPWSVEALRFMQDCGIEFAGAYIDGQLCAAAIDNGKIIELCAPDYLQGKACSALLHESMQRGTVRFLCDPYPEGHAALMSFSGKPAYFNLFLE